jgi:hypothetical protein
MTLSLTELAEIREVIAKLLDQLKLDAYLFEVEPKEDQWEIKVECAVDKECWETVRLTAKKEILFHGADDAIMHEALLDNWREALSACKKKQ